MIGLRKEIQDAAIDRLDIFGRDNGISRRTPPLCNRNSRRNAAQNDLSRLSFGQTKWTIIFAGGRLIVGSSQYGYGKHAVVYLFPRRFYAYSHVIDETGSCKSGAFRLCIGGAKMMRERKIGSVFIEQDARIVGIVTEADIVRRAVG